MAHWRKVNCEATKGSVKLAFTVNIKFVTALKTTDHCNIKNIKKRSLLSNVSIKKQIFFMWKSQGIEGLLTWLY